MASSRKLNIKLISKAAKLAECRYKILKEKPYILGIQHLRIAKSFNFHVQKGRSQAEIEILLNTHSAYTTPAKERQRPSCVFMSQSRKDLDRVGLSSPPVGTYRVSYTGVEKKVMSPLLKPSSTSRRDFNPRYREELKPYSSSLTTRNFNSLLNRIDGKQVRFAQR